jgi:hypothetical protein
MPSGAGRTGRDFAVANRERVLYSARVTNKLPKLIIAAGLALSLPIGCKDKDKDAKQEVEVKTLAAPAHGSPVAAEFVKFIGEGEERGMEVLLYNTGDKTAAGYFLLARYYDADDKLLMVKPGTPFEKDTDFTSMSGGRYKCEPKHNTTLTIEGDFLAIPAAATRAEVLITRVDAIGEDGMAIENWWSQDHFNEWPG